MRKLVLAGLALLTGCASVYEERALEDHERTATRISSAQQQLRAAASPSPSVVTESTLRFTQKSVSFDAGQMLPPGIRRVTIRTTGRHSLTTVAGWIEQLTRVPVRVSPDALWPTSAFMIEKAPIKDSQASTAQEPGQAAAIAIESRGGPRILTPEADPALLSVDYSGDLHGLLSLVASRAGVQWTYRDGHILFFRLVSRSIAVRGLPGNLSQSGGVQLGSGMSLTSDMEMNIWPGIEKSLAQMVSRAGWFRLDSTLGTVTVHDSMANVETIERYLDGVNRQLSRQVSLNVEVLQVTLNNRFERGIDWNYVRQVTGMGTFMAGGPPSVTTNSARIGFVRQNADGSVSSLMFKALESFGRVSTAYSSVINTMNRQPVPLGSINTQSYLKQIAPSSGINASGGLTFGSPALTPGEIVTGFNITVLPVILDSNMVLLQCGVSISSLRELASFTSGTGLAQQTIQQPSVSSFLTQQRMAVRAGDTVVLSGFDTDTTNSRQADVWRDAIPGTRASGRDRTTLVLMITPRLLEF